MRFRKKDVWCTTGGCGSYGPGFVENAPGNKCVGWCWESEITLDQIDDYEIIYLDNSIMSANKTPLARAHLDPENLKKTGEHQFTQWETRPILREKSTLILD